MGVIDIFGEYHIEYERNRVEKEILKRHSIQPYDYLLSEEVGDNIYLDTISKLQGILNKNYSIVPRSFILSLKLDIPLIGIDDWEEQKFLHTSGERVDVETSFKIRESRMLHVIKEYWYNGYRCAVIVGDSHLRTARSELGEPSVINSISNFKGVSILRSPLKEVD